MKSSTALRVLAGLILIRGFAGGGINMTAGLFLSPVSQDLGIGIGTLSLYLSVMSAVTVLWLPLAGKLVNRCPVRLLATVAAALQGFSFAACGLLNHAIGWYLLAIPQAMGAAILVSLLSPILLNRWFPRNTGAVLGIQMAFVYLFAAVLQPAASRLIAADGWRQAYFILGLTAFFAEAPAALLLLRDRPVTGASGGPASRAPTEPGGLNIPQQTAVRSASFVLLLIFMIALTGAAVFTQHIPAWGVQLGYPLEQVGLALSLASIGSALGAVAIGLVCDRIGGLYTCYGIITLWLLAVGGFLAGGKGFAIFAASSFLHGVASASIPVIVPVLTTDFYGKQDYEGIFAKVSVGAPLASILLVPAYGYVYDTTGSYVAVLILLAVLLGGAAVSIRLGWANRCTTAGCPVWRGRRVKP